MSDEQKNDTPVEDEGFVVEDASTVKALPSATGMITVPGVAADLEGDEPAEKPAEGAPAAKAPEPEEELPIGVKKRVARAERQRDDAERKADEFDAKLKQAQAMIDALKAKKEGKASKDDVDPNDFASYEEYAAARSAREKARDAPAAPAPPPDTEFVEALGDLKESVRVADGKLWDKTVETKEDGSPVVTGISRHMVIEMADADDPAALLRAVVELSDERREEIAKMSPRATRRALRDLSTKPVEDKPAEPKAPPRDPGTGQFRKSSEAPEPISPVGGSSPTRPLAKLSTDDFIAQRNAEMRQSARFDW